MTYYIEIVSYETGDVARRMGPYAERKADKVDAGININLNHERFYTRLTQTDNKAT